MPFGTELVHYAVGPAVCGVPGVPAGLDALWSRFGRLPWPHLCEPALTLARTGVTLPRAHAACLEMLAPVMTMSEGARIPRTRRAPAQDGRSPRPAGVGARVRGRCRRGTAFGLRRDDRGQPARARRRSRRSGHPRRSRRLQARWSAPVAVGFAGRRVRPRSGLAPLAKPLRAARVATWPRTSRPGSRPRQRARGRRFRRRSHHEPDGRGHGGRLRALASLGLGSGDFLPGFDLHLNSMLGETDLLRGELEPGTRMASMMAPSIALADSGTVVVAAGAAGGTRLRSALVQVLAGVLDEGSESPTRSPSRGCIPPAGLYISSLGSTPLSRRRSCRPAGTSARGPRRITTSAA